MKEQNKKFLFLLPLFAFINFSIVKATAQTLLADSTPWYGAGWVWAGLILFIIILTGFSNLGKR